MQTKKPFFMHKIFSGTVVKGLGKGKEFGFPTVNIRMNDNKLHIDTGVYAVKIIVDNQSYRGMLYVGTRPTLNLHEKTIEIHILEFDKNIYNEQILFEILHKIRDEIHFETVDKLIEQLHQDREMVYNVNQFKNLKI